MGDTSTLGFDFVDLMTKMMSDPAPVAKAQIDLFNDSVALWQKAAERMWMMRCVYRKLKLGHSGGEVRQGWHVI